MGEPRSAPEDVDRETSALGRLFEGAADPVPPESPLPTPSGDVPSDLEPSDV